MTALNVVRFRVKPGKQKAFVDYQSGARRGFAGYLGGSVIKTGEQTFCLVGEWKDMASLIKARPEMIGVLDGMRDLLEDLGGGLGVTDPVSGEVVALMPPGAGAGARKSARKAKRGARKTALKTAVTARKTARKAKKATKRSR